jgi:putative oxidoreductase
MPRLPAPASDAALLVARIVLGVVLVAHGWQKLVDNGVGATGEGFAAMGIPLAGAAALFATVVELGGGLLIIAGAATQVVGVLVVLNMLGAGWFAGHFTSGVYAAQGGWELVGVIAVGAMLLVAGGPGRFSVDHALTARRRATVDA